MNTASRLRIAVADDEHDLRDYLTRVIRRLGHEVVASATTGQELVDQCHSLPRSRRYGRDHAWHERN